MLGHKYLTFSLLYAFVAAQQIKVPIPKNPASKHIVKSNFFGFSIEISFVDSYFGDGTTPIPPPIINYFQALRQRTAKGDPLRIRIGGNAGDSSPFVPTQPPPIFRHLTGERDDQPVTFGPSLFNVLKQVGEATGGVQYIFGLNLNDPSSQLIPQSAAAAATTLGDSLDAFLVGNEPDRYSTRGKRPASYSMSAYIQDFRKAASSLKSTPAGDLLTKPILAGPAICCRWDLAPLLQAGLLAANKNDFKYIALQHYGQGGCDPTGSHGHKMDQFTKHSNVVDLATWQNPDKILKTLSAAVPKPPALIMDEFNSIPCGGTPDISDTFAVGSLWTADYALQLASVGYSAVHLHTREHGISYNPINPPVGPAISNAPFTTGPGYYAMLAVTEALNGGIDAGVTVADLNLQKSKTDSSLAGYAIYDARSGGVSRLVFINYGDSAVNLAIPAKVLTAANVRYLSAASATEKTQIAWGGQTINSDEGAKLSPVSTPWATADVSLACGDGCTVAVPPSQMAVAFATGEITKPPPGTSNHGGGRDGQGNGAGADKPVGAAGTLMPFGLGMILVMIAPLFELIF